uniref:Lymphocyte specific protein 1 n=1 Tax=Sus scrofa TaxID=9823 RepID=A0A8D1GR88_PIG
MAEAPSHPDSEEQQELLVEEGSGLAAQWSLEDEEEAARERRRRERDRQLQDQDEDEGGPGPEQQEQEKLLKPPDAPELDEDEGFGDWSQKPEQRRQPWGPGETSDSGDPLQGESPEGEQEEDRQVGGRSGGGGSLQAPDGVPPTPWAPPPRSPPKCPLAEGAGGRARDGGRGGEGSHSWAPQGPGPLPDQLWRPGGCYISTHLQPADVREALGPPPLLPPPPPLPPSGRPSSIPTEGSRPGQHVCGSPARVCLEELCLSPDSELQEELGSEASEPRGPAGPVQGSPGLAETEEGDVQPQRCQQPRTPSPSVLEGTAPGSPPLSPSTKLIDRTESLHRSIQKSNSVKKSQPALPISKIDGRLEQYTQAIETAGRAHKLTRQPSIELPSMAVASTKSRWETGEVQAQSAAKPPSCKDIVAGDMSKKSLWEQKGGPKTSSTVKSTPSGKRYKFVAAGHGKYEKVLVDEGSVP